MRAESTVIIGIIIILSLLFLFYITSKDQQVEILYFYNPNCLVAAQTDNLIEYVKVNFDDRVIIKSYFTSMYKNDPPDTQEVKELREQYKIYGAPVIIINGKEFTKAFKNENIRGDICKEFLIKPEVC